MRDISQEFVNRAYSVDDGNEVDILCEDCADLVQGGGVTDLNPIEEYESEGNRQTIMRYRCERCGKEQARKDGRNILTYEEVRAAVRAEFIKALDEEVLPKLLTGGYETPGFDLDGQVFAWCSEPTDERPLMVEGRVEVNVTMENGKPKED